MADPVGVVVNIAGFSWFGPGRRSRRRDI